MDTPISRAEHLEFMKRMEEEHKRLGHRIEEVEKTGEQSNRLLLSVEKLAHSMETMQKEQKDQGERLKKLEGRDGEMWRKVTGHIITAAISILVGYIFAQIGII